MKQFTDKVLRILHWFLKYDFCNRTKRWNVDFSNVLERYKDFIEKYSGLKYQVEWVEIGSKSKRMFVGGQCIQDIYWAIPCDIDFILKFYINNRRIEFIKLDCKGAFKYTGGCYIGERLFCFSRSQDNILCINMSDNEYMYLDMKTNYGCEHHYGGICINNRTVLQAPRSCNTFLQYDILTNQTIQIKLSRFVKRFKYCGSIYHPNGCIYFFPESCGPVIKYSAKEGEWRYIGMPLSSLVYDAKICTDGNIYGYSALKGILKIDVYANKTEMLYKDIEFGAYGTKLGLNGMIYSIPGKGKMIWSYDPVQNILKKVWGMLGDAVTCAGGVTTSQGMIIGSPSDEGKLLLMTPDKTIDIPSDIYDAFYIDCY